MCPNFSCPKDQTDIIGRVPSKQWVLGSIVRPLKIKIPITEIIQLSIYWWKQNYQRSKHTIYATCKHLSIKSLFPVFIVSKQS